MSPYTVIIRRSGNPFELAHVLVSWLIGAGYDAYVVVGCATRDTCMAIKYRSICADIPDESEDLEKAPADAINGWRTHAWVLVLPGYMGIDEPFFIEPSEGEGHLLDSEKYQFIDSVYNHENYYANVQSTDIGLDSLNYDLSDLSAWEHLLAGEPHHRRQMVGIDIADKKTAVQTEKHLDMPVSWVEKLEISTDEYSQRYPGSHKVIHYKKVLLDKFSPYSERDGVVKRIRTFEDYALTVPLITYEWYKHRVDKMETVRIDHTKREIRETFGIGRRDHLLRSKKKPK